MCSTWTRHGLLCRILLLTPPYARGVVACAQVDIRRLLLNMYTEVLDAALKRLGFVGKPTQQGVVG